MPGWRARSEDRLPRADDLELVDRVRVDVVPDEDGLSEWFDGYVRNHRERIAHDVGYVRRFASPPARVLDCGAVPLLLLAALQELGYEVEGVDLAPERFGSALVRRGLRVAACDVEREVLPFADGAFALVTFNELFEHLRIDPIHTMSEVVRVLEPEGILLLSTPNLRSLRGLRNLLLHGHAHAVSGDIYEQYHKLRRLGHMGHVREYTAVEIVELLERLGLRVEQVIGRGGHGRGVVGLAERALPSWRPFQTIVARKPPAARAAEAKA